MASMVRSSNDGFLMNMFFHLPVVLVIVIGLFPQVAMIKAATRLECVSDSLWFPKVRRAPATHKERASERLDGRTTVKFKFVVRYHTVDGSISDALLSSCS
jgi:hypothetical protein